MGELMSDSERKRAALCFSGQMRSVERAYENHIYPHIIKPNESSWDVDVFVHSWFDVSDLGKKYEIGGHKAEPSIIPLDTVDKMFKLYNPVKALLERQRDFPTEMGGNRPSHVPAIFTVSKLFSMRACQLLKEQYEEEKGFRYDIVGNVRFDLGLIAPVILDSINPCFYTTSDHASHHVDVTFSFMGADVSNIAMKLYNSYCFYWKTDGIQFLDEPLMMHHLETNDITVDRRTEWHGYDLVR